MNRQFGTLYLIPTLLGATTAEQVIPQGTLEIVRTLRFFVVENVRTARRMLSKMNMPCPIDELTFVELDKHDKSNNPDLMTYLGEALNGNDIGPKHNVTLKYNDGSPYIYKATLDDYDIMYSEYQFYYTSANDESFDIIVEMRNLEDNDPRAPVLAYTDPRGFARINGFPSNSF